MTDRLAQLDEAFRAKRKTYLSFTRNIETLVDTLLDVKKIQVFRSEGRTKTNKSFQEKIRREGKEDKYSSLDDMTDLSGVRIVAFGLDDVDEVCKVIKENFEIDEENSMDKRLTIPADQFGYLSIHYVVSHKLDRLNLAENVKFKGMKAEVQVRTVLQHAWAVLDHKFRYGSPDDLPREVQRKLFRIGAQLEASDEDLTAVQRNIFKLRETYAKKMKSGNFETELNRESLKLFVQKNELSKKIIAQAKKAGLRVGAPGYLPDGSLARLITTLSALKIQNLDGFREKLQGLSNNAEQLFHGYHEADERRLLISQPTVLRLLLSMEPGPSGDIALLNSKLSGRMKAVVTKARAGSTNSKGTGHPA